MSEVDEAIASVFRLERQELHQLLGLVPGYAAEAGPEYWRSTEVLLLVAPLLVAGIAEVAMRFLQEHGGGASP